MNTAIKTIDTFVDRHGIRLGRVCIGILFLISGVGSLLGFKGFSVYVGTLLPFGTIAAIVSIIIHIGGALSLLFGIRIRIGAYALIFFTFLTILLIHGPALMKATDVMETQMELVMTLKNLAIIGGLLLVARNTAATST